MERVVACILLSLGLMRHVDSLNNGIALVPERGFNTWNFWRCRWNETIIYETADALVSSGLREAGYVYLNLDGCELSPCPSSLTEEQCHNFTRDGNGVLHDVDLARLPHGAASACDYIHSKGLLCGAYTDAADTTCQGRPGTLFYESQDAQMWASFGADLIKVDNCGTVPPGWEKPERRYPPLRDALNATGRRILYSLCVWGVDDPWLWGPNVGNTWRIYGDSDLCDHTPGFGNGCWKHVMDITDAAVGLGQYAAPGGFNDLDILLVANAGMTTTEDRAHFSIWVITKSPLLLGNDVRAMDAETRATLMNPEVLAVSGDELGAGGDLVNRTCAATPGGAELPCSGGGGGGGGVPTLRVAPCCTPAGSPQCASQRFNVSAASYPGATANVIRCDGRPGECVALYDCAAPVVSWSCAQDAKSCSGAAMKHFQWSVVPSAGRSDSAFQLQSLALAGQCLAPNASGVLATVPCVAGAQLWTTAASGDGGQLVDVATGLCAYAAPSAASAPVDTWAVPLANGDRAVVLLNRRDAMANVTFYFEAIGLPSGTQAHVRDLWARADLGVAVDSFTGAVPAHGAVMLRLARVAAGENSGAADADDAFAWAQPWQPAPPRAAVENAAAVRDACRRGERGCIARAH